MLTIKKLKDMDAGKIFATGVGTYPELIDKEVRWVAVRGEGYHDWTIYYHYPSNSEIFISKCGDKCFSKDVIKRLVPCDDESFAMYRF